MPMTRTPAEAALPAGATGGLDAATAYPLARPGVAVRPPTARPRPRRTERR
ncbi:hypothetical protein AB0B27_25730 [Micromonospora rifamycinica]|uniref:hypothetical protein n=1 Tax=Micromonospora rifamycinica TaxID=291594 RepID=UPI00340728F5